MKIIIFLLFAIFAISQDKFLYWLPHGYDTQIKSSQSAAHSHSRMKTIMYQLNNMDGSMNIEAKYILPTLETKELKLNANLTNLEKSSYDNYHALVANGTKENNIYSTVFYLYKHGRPSGHSPKELIELQKATLEIVPLPLPREHDRYKASKNYRFKIVFDGEPLADSVLFLETLSGFSDKYLSDKNGIVKVTLPNDFVDVKNNKRENKPSYFVLKTKQESDLKNYYATLSMPYHVNPTDYWQSQELGLLGIGGGFLIGFAFMSLRGKGGMKNG